MPKKDTWYEYLIFVFQMKASIHKIQKFALYKNRRAYIPKALLSPL
jgi:hypothetical protein